MSSQPSPRPRQRRGRYTGITQERAADFLAEENAPLEPAPKAAAPEPELEPALEPEPEPAFEGDDRAALREAATALTREKRRAGQSLDKVMGPQPWSLGAETRVWLIGSAAALLAAAAGYAIGVMTATEPTAPRAAAAEPVVGEKPVNREAVLAAVEQETAEAFSQLKQKQFKAARERFAALAQRHPELPSFALEVARCYFYEGNFLQAQRVLEPLFKDERVSSEAHFILGLVQLTERSFEQAAGSFRRSSQANPSRSDAHFMWAEALRREGRLAAASERYQTALERNQYETNELTYRLKTWLARVQAGTLKPEQLAQLDASLKAPAPGSEALVADAARALKAGDLGKCARRLGEAKQGMEPLLFLVVLQDPLFNQESWRPELAPFYKR